MKFFIFLFLLPLSLFAMNPSLPRRVIGFWDNLTDDGVEDSLIHRTLEMPLNHLGLDVEFYNIQDPLPNIQERTDVVGIILCFKEKTAMKDPKAFIGWAIKAMDAGKKMILIRNPGFLADVNGVFTPSDLQNQLFERVGVINEQKWIEYTYDYKIISEKNALISFEGNYPTPLPGFNVMRASNYAKSYLIVGTPAKPDTYSDLIIMGPMGAYVSEFYANNYDPLLYVQSPRALKWYINPFLFFELAFDLKTRPIPDVSTLAGRRIFYSTCHGDAWNIDTSLEKYKNQNMTCSEAILEEVIKPNHDIPISVGIVAADVDPAWVGKKKSQEVARKYFDLPQVEPASHTYSHPFFWDFFETGGPEKEINYLHLYQYGTWQNSFLSWFRAKYYAQFKPEELKKEKLKWGYVTPRAYANEPFNLNKEITGSVTYLDNFAPPDKQINLLIWSGDSLPWPTPVALCEKEGIYNHGGGFVRFDSDYPSYIFVFPIARKPEGIIQPYASANADNNYTYGWTSTFYGFQFLPDTLKNTESPRRIKPIHLYFHSYSGQFLASINAILSNLDYIRKEKPIFTTTTRYCQAVRGFFSVEIDELGERKWKIRNRKGLQTVRFDNAENLAVDFSNSIGVIGYKKYQDSLYVHLDRVISEPIVSLTQGNNNTIPFLIDSSWEIGRFQRDTNGVQFKAKGWGKFAMQWNIPSGNYRIIASSPAYTEKTYTFSTYDNLLQVEIELPYDQMTTISIIREEG